MQRAIRCFRAILLAAILPAAVYADLNQTAVLSTSGGTNLNLDTGAVAGSGGDIQFSSNGITPQGSARAVNVGFSSAAAFGVVSQLVVQLYPGYSVATIPTATLQQKAGSLTDSFFVHTNGGHYAKLLVTAFSSSSITLQYTTFGVAAGGNNGGAPTITAIRNNSSNIFAGFPNYGIAPSSIFVIVGTGLADPGMPVLQSSAAPGLPLTLNGASISATVNGVTVHPAIYYTSPNQIAAVLPASTPVGTGTLTVTYNGAASNAAPLQVVPAAIGINTFNSNSAVATDAVTGALLSYTNSGTAGETIVLWTTGLGADADDSDTAFSSTPHAVGTALEIYVAGTPATILYQGSAGYPGVDQINLTIPASTPDGCWIPIAAVSDGVVGNIATIPVHTGGGACVDPVNGLSGNQIQPGPGPRTLRTGFLALIQTPTESNADGAFEKYTGIYAPTNAVSPGGCIVNNLTPVNPSPFTGLDPGGIVLTGPGGTALTLANQLGIKGAFYGALATGAIPQSGGAFTFKGGGGADVGPFSATITFTNPLMNWTNQSAAATINRSQGFTATWSGGNPGSYVLISGSSTFKASSISTPMGAEFICLANASDGQFTVPSYVLSALPPGSGGVQVSNDIYVPMPASGLDISFALGDITFNVKTTFN